MLIEENQKICKIVSEFSIFLLDNGINCLNIKIVKSKVKISLIFECEKIEGEVLDEIDRAFKVKRQESLEIYGWELIGCNDTEEDLELTSALINYLSYYHIDDKTRFNLVRYL